jgi:putative MATE family efflux protein
MEMPTDTRQSNFRVTMSDKVLQKALFTMAWPVVVLNLLQVVNSLLDRFFIGHLPKESMTAHGGAISVLFMLFSLAFSISVGTGAIVSRAFGAGEVSEYRNGAQQSLRVATYFGLILGVVGFIGSPFMAVAILPRTDTESVRLMGQFLQAYSVGVPAMCIIQVLASSLRSIGDTRSPMFLSGFQILIHIVLNYLFIFESEGGLPGFGLGLLGSGVALSLSAWVSAIVYVVYARKTPIATRWSLTPPTAQWAERIFRIAIPSAFQAVLRTLSLTAFTLILANVPGHDAAIAAMTTGFAIESLMFAPAFGLSAAAGALVGQSLGAKKPDRAMKIGYLTAMVAVVISTVFAVPIFILVPEFAGSLVGFKPEVTLEVVRVVRWLCVTEPLFCAAMVFFGGLQGAGDTKNPLWISIISLWGLRVPFGMLLAMAPGSALIGSLTLPTGFAMGATGAWIAMAFTQGLQGLMAAHIWRQGHWKNIKV